MGDIVAYDPRHADFLVNFKKQDVITVKKIMRDSINRVIEVYEWENLIRLEGETHPFVTYLYRLANEEEIRYFHLKKMFKP